MESKGLTKLGLNLVYKTNNFIGLYKGIKPILRGEDFQRINHKGVVINFLYIASEKVTFRNLSVYIDI